MDTRSDDLRLIMQEQEQVDALLLSHLRHALEYLRGWGRFIDISRHVKPNRRAIAYATHFASVSIEMHGDEH